MPLEVVWSALSRTRLREIRDYVAQDKPDAAAKLATRIVVLAEALKNHPYLGRAGSKPGIRELVVGGTPYLIFYRVRRQRVTINSIWHGAQLKRQATRKAKASDQR